MLMLVVLGKVESLIGQLVSKPRYELGPPENFRLLLDTQKTHTFRNICESPGLQLHDTGHWSPTFLAYMLPKRHFCQ
jgi:hypothetical protein